MWGYGFSTSAVLPLYGMSDVVTVPRGGINLPPADLLPGQPYRILFVTDKGRDATSTNIADYDSFVTTDANAVPELVALNTTFQAVASTTSVDARTHTNTDPTPSGSTGVPIYSVDGTRIADDYDELWSVRPSIQVPVGFTASGAAANQAIWTGTYPTGIADSGLELGALGQTGRGGDPRTANYSWIRGYSISTSAVKQLYGISAILSDGAQVVRLGTPANPSAFIPTSKPPMIGQTWQPTVDHSTFMPNAALDFVMVGWGKVDVSMMPYGTLLLGATAMTLTATPGQGFSVPIGNQSSLIGMRLSAQAASLDATPQIQLANAIDFVIGG